VCQPIEAVAAPIVAELVQNARNSDVSRFQQLVSDNVGTDTGWQAIARMFRLTQSAVHMAGMGTAVARQIKEMTLNYFEDRFASWIVDQGGWVCEEHVHTRICFFPSFLPSPLYLIFILSALFLSCTAFLSRPFHFSYTCSFVFPPTFPYLFLSISSPFLPVLCTLLSFCGMPAVLQWLGDNRCSISYSWLGWVFD